jgi:hypothetical protein
LHGAAINLKEDALRRVCVILGAGASHDVHDLGSSVKSLEFKPPLATELFNIDANDVYLPIVGRYPGAALLAQPLARRIAEGEVGVEEALRGFAVHTDEQLREAYKHVPPYLRDLMHSCTAFYTVYPSCYIQLIVRLAAEIPHRILFLNLNYDTYVESAIEAFTSNAISFQDFPDYVVPDRQMNLVKLHGSVDWFHPLPAVRETWVEAVGAWAVSDRPRQEAWEVRLGASRTDTERNGQRWLYPVITAPLTQKTLEDASLPAPHLAWAREFLGTCNKFLIIGTSGLDDDLMELLNGSIPPDSLPLVHVVGTDKAADTLNKFADHVRAFSRFKGVTQSSPPVSHNGFRKFLSSQEFLEFAQAHGAG